VTFAPQNMYIFKDRFRTLQRKANSLGKTLFSLITPQHQQIVDWLQTLTFVDGERIAFYGMSYGGKTAMRVPPLGNCSRGGSVLGGLFCWGRLFCWQ